MNKYFIFSFSLFLVIAASSCAYNNEEELYPCTIPLTVSYRETIAPIIENYCYDCHSNANVQISQIPLEGYENLKVKAAGGQLIDRITNTDIALRMPQGRSPLDTCDIRKIKNWINDGYPDN